MDGWMDGWMDFQRNELNLDIIRNPKIIIIEI